MIKKESEKFTSSNILEGMTSIDAYTMQANLDEIDARTNKTNSKKGTGKSGKSSSGKKTTKLSPEAQKKVNEILGVK